MPPGKVLITPEAFAAIGTSSWSWGNRPWWHVDYADSDGSQGTPMQPPGATDESIDPIAAADVPDTPYEVLPDIGPFERPGTLTPEESWERSQGSGSLEPLETFIFEVDISKMVEVIGETPLPEIIAEAIINSTPYARNVRITPQCDHAPEAIPDWSVTVSSLDGSLLPRPWPYPAVLPCLDEVVRLNDTSGETKSYIVKRCTHTPSPDGKSGTTLIEVERWLYHELVVDGGE